MNSTVELDSSNEGENLNPNIALVIPKREKGTGEKLGDTIELNSDEDSDIDITEEKKPILKRSTAAFNSTKNDNLTINATTADTSFNLHTPFLTPQSSTPATAYKSIITSTPSETPRFKLSNDMELADETPENHDEHQSEDDASQGNSSTGEDSSSTTEGAVSKPNLSETDEDESVDVNKTDNTYPISETIKIGNEESTNINTSISNQNIGSIDGDESFSNVEVTEDQLEKSPKVLNNVIHGGGDNTTLISKSVQVIDELYNSKISDPETTLQPSLLPKIEVGNIKPIEKNILEKRHEVVEPNDEIYQESSKLLDLSTSGEESDIEDDATAKEDIDPSFKLTLPSKKRRLEDIENLPETCTLLRTKNGGRVYVVGTAHFSHESQVDVATVIQTVQPDIVVLELCKDRTNILHLDEETVLEEAKNLTMDKMILAIRQNGTIQGVMYLLLLSMSAHLTKELGMAPGGEFRRAFREAHSVPGCLVHLGDRPINITLKRALGSLSIWQKLKLGFNILTSKDSITKEDVEKCKQKDLLEGMLEEMAGEFPALSRVFVQERDLYLAHSLKLAANRPFGHHCSTSKSTQDFAHEEPVVVGVVGIGHVPGIIQNWETVRPEDVAKVVFIPPMSRTEKFTRLTIRMSFACLTIYTGYRLFKNPVSKAISVIQQTITH